MITKTTLQLAPCLSFDDQAEEAAKFYTGLFPDSRVTTVSHYPNGFDNPSNTPRGHAPRSGVDSGGSGTTRS